MVEVDVPLSISTLAENRLSISSNEIFILFSNTSERNRKLLNAMIAWIKRKNGTISI